MQCQLIVLGTAALVAFAMPAWCGDRGDCTGTRAGPSPTPFSFDDFGGTPDITAPADMGLSNEELSRLLTRLADSEASVREAAATQLIRDGEGATSTLKQALWGNQGARNTEIRDALSRAERNDSEDQIAGLLAISPDDPSLGKGATAALRVSVMLRALDKTATLAAYKVLIEFSPRYAGLFRVAIGRILVSHGLDVMPALIYGRKSDDKEIHMFCVKWIRDLGEPLLSEQVKIENPRRLAQLLEAYAAVNDLDAIDVTLALANHESVFVRRAARASLEAYGKNVKWPARRSYENSLGKEPAEGASTEAILAELFAHYDQERLSRSNALFERGKEALAAGELEVMDKIFRDVLRQAPMFPRRAEMAEGLLNHADRLEREGDYDRARRQIVLARRVVGDDHELAPLITSRLKWRDAERLRQSGLVDVERYARIAQTDSENTEAASLARELSGVETPTARIVLKSVLVSFFVFLSTLLLFLRYRQERETECEEK